MDVLSVYQLPQRKGKKDEEYAHLVFFNIPKLTLTTARGQVNALNLITLCTLHPHGAFSISFLSLKNYNAKAWHLPLQLTLSLCVSLPHSHMQTHTLTHTSSVCKDYIIHTSTISWALICWLPSVCLHQQCHVCGSTASWAQSEIPSEDNVGKVVVKKESFFVETSQSWRF